MVPPSWATTEELVGATRGPGAGAQPRLQPGGVAGLHLVEQGLAQGDHPGIA